MAASHAKAAGPKHLSTSATRKGGGDTAAAKRHWKMPWAQVFALLLIFAGTCVFLYPQVASWFSQKEQSRITELGLNSMEVPPNSDAAYQQEQLDRAHAYNDALASGAVLEVNGHVPVSDGSSANQSFVYEDLLNVDDSGFMGRLKYDALGIDLPIYHGTDDETLRKGVGHLEGTSLPVGGIGTRSVLTAHRGLPEATLFNNLNEAKVGDRFTVSVYDQVLTYEVIKSEVIEPSETQEILADPNRDLVTLVTCTPLGINTHRILVTAERVTPTPQSDIAAAGAVPDLPGFPWWAVILGVEIILISVAIWRLGYPPKPRAKKEGPAAE